MREIALRKACAVVMLVFCAVAASGFADMAPAQTQEARQHSSAANSAANTGLSIASAARQQVGRTVIYDPAYVRLSYPGGDVPIDRGVCTDVVIRALRDALDMDLQELVHEDMKRRFGRYPKTWGMKAPDRNIDHRRVTNLMVYFDHRRYGLTVSKTPDDYRPGDLVTCIVPSMRPHIMIVSDRKALSGRPLIIHNIGAGAKEEDRLFEFPMTGHYRIR